MEIREFQEHIRKLYYDRDARRGKERTMLWFVEEVGELAEAVRKGDLNSIREEIADVFAWLVSLANLFDVDLESAVREKYPERCLRCGKFPCECDEE
ncbi:MAG: nucleotide pyrophosphohydrolase [Archaeoglobales archaeon]|nr:MAG: nucleotide pyrophosphohydrolase [Archaeoglobales archaeon]